MRVSMGAELGADECMHCTVVQEGVAATAQEQLEEARAAGEALEVVMPGSRMACMSISM